MESLCTHPFILHGMAKLSTYFSLVLVQCLILIETAQQAWKHLGARILSLKVKVNNSIFVTNPDHAISQVNIKSLEDVVRAYLKLAEEKTETAKGESQQMVLDIEDLDNIQTPER